MDLYNKNATELSKMLRDKKISSVELTKSVFNRIEDVDKKIGAYITLNKENALKKAEEIDTKLSSGENLNPLAGIPLALKDN
ncbi:MAG: Asp-tRNA(Asn)/Glu-tRNA(Gln) amidotransferase subunit GatA, partial [Clostridiales bacterium]|nr:Asp-tRNA(Asn)/Glu-tRNA(Gln) amidotransferase subunit GatA [Clostridiales bacterium]